MSNDADDGRPQFPPCFQFRNILLVQTLKLPVIVKKN
jgi:hypothetical protein